MYMEPNDPKETADDTTLTEDWQDPDFGGYELEEGDDWSSIRCSFLLEPSPANDISRCLAGIIYPHSYF